MAVAVRSAGPRTASAPGDAGWYAVHPERRVRAGAGRARQTRLPSSTYHRRQAVAAGLLVALVLAVLVALGTLGGGPLPAPDRGSSTSRAQQFEGPVYVVQPGDTFWSIAARLRPAEDPRPLVDKLVAAHGDSTLHVGERIPLPVR